MNLNTLVMNLAFHVMNMCMYLLSHKMHWKIAANDTHTSIQRWTQFNTSNIKISRHSRLYRPVSPGPSGPGLWWVLKTPFVFRNKRFISLPSLLPKFGVYGEGLLYIVQKVYKGMSRTIRVSIAGPPATRASVLAYQAMKGLGFSHWAMKTIASPGDINRSANLSLLFDKQRENVHLLNLN